MKDLHHNKQHMVCKLSVIKMKGIVAIEPPTSLTHSSRMRINLILSLSFL